jgi:deoxyribodipyrimidine photo-lyase
MNDDLFGSADDFEPTRAAAQARLAAVRPHEYARTRNHLDGAVTRLSPYITHGLLTLPQVLRAVRQRHRIDAQHKFVYELGWREYFHHVWSHRGEAIFESLHEGVLPESAYRRELPEDLLQGRTGVRVIDQAVRRLYATGWLHNHARMWLASYAVHLRKLHWRSGADWMHAQLLDGDLASNHLSWQWVAGTGSHKPYLFNAENVARYAPAEWHSPGSVVDATYESLDQLARSARAVRPASHAGPAMMPAVMPPATSSLPPQAFADPFAPEALRGREVQLLHPWNLGDPPVPGALRLGLWLREFHARWPWSERRWQFVGRALRAASDRVHLLDAATLREALRGATRIHGTRDPHLAPWLGALPLAAKPRLFPAVVRPCASFSQWWHRATRGWTFDDQA